MAREPILVETGTGLWPRDNPILLCCQACGKSTIAVSYPPRGGIACTTVIKEVGASRETSSVKHHA
jgi:hypothetical protein